MTAKRIALVLGATGGIGGETASALLRRGWTVTGMVRDPARCRSPEGADPLAGMIWVAGDAMNAEDIHRAAERADVIVHAVNPPGYRNWDRLVLPMIDNTIAAAQMTNARVVLPGTIYNYGDDAVPNLSEETPQHPKTRKGCIRVALEQRLEDASQRGTPALIVRFGDFFGPAPGSSWFSQGLVTPGKRLGVLRYPGAKGVGHAWAYLPDAGETIARLLDRSADLEPFARFHFKGHWDADGTQMLRAIITAIGRRQIAIRSVPWPAIAIAGLVSETPREIYKMRYLWRTPFELDNSRLTAFLGQEPHTPLEDAVKTTLKALNVR
jgi:nucleoside-diphosphate-sugar epimerase